jgi:hypothetical protein
LNMTVSFGFVPKIKALNTYVFLPCNLFMDILYATV